MFQENLTKVVVVYPSNADVLPVVISLSLRSWRFSGHSMSMKAAEPRKRAAETGVENPNFLLLIPLAGSPLVFAGPGGGHSQKNWVGVCGPLPKTLTLFMTKICDFPYPIYDLTKNLIPYL